MSIPVDLPKSPGPGVGRPGGGLGTGGAIGGSMNGGLGVGMGSGEVKRKASPVWNGDGMGGEDWVELIKAIWGLEKAVVDKDVQEIKGENLEQVSRLRVLFLVVAFRHCRFPRPILPLAYNTAELMIIPLESYFRSIAAIASSLILSGFRLPSFYGY
jgi:hypothetical protein